MKLKKVAASTGIAFAALSSVFAAPAMANYDHNRYDNDWRRSDNNRIVCVWVKDHGNNWRGWHDNNNKKLVCFVYDDGRFYSLNHHHNNWDNNHHWNWRY